ncbi:hypothetical protein [Effusibacillus consociatus]|uniref:Uncharacterized protein n=1 Tax=Effusibacillus consociatus TaxID=1117041 RepID=A0ABV9Q3G3_9BACL
MKQTTLMLICHNDHRGTLTPYDSSKEKKKARNQAPLLRVHVGFRTSHCDCMSVSKVRQDTGMGYRSAKMTLGKVVL